MGGTYGILIVYCEDRVLKTLLRGAAADSGLEFCPVAGMGEVRICWRYPYLLSWL